MNKLLISYDICQEEENKREYLENFLMKECRKWVRLNGSVWVVLSIRTAENMFKIISTEFAKSLIGVVNITGKKVECNLIQDESSPQGRYILTSDY